MVTAGITDVFYVFDLHLIRRRERRVGGGGWKEARTHLL